MIGEGQILGIVWMLSEKVGGEESGACDGTVAGEEAVGGAEEQARCPKVPVEEGRP